MSEVQFPRALSAERLANAKVTPGLANTLAAIPPGSVAVKVGVRLGEETATLLRCGNIARMIAIDHFDLHRHAKGAEAAKLAGKPHEEFIRSRFSDAIKAKRFETRRGRLDAVKALPAESANAFFIRGCRAFSPLMQELYMCDAKLRSRGMIWVADYIMADYTNGERYEVVRAVNEFVVKTGYALAFLVLDNAMFCTVVLRRPA